jgi:putrescine transport system permease protein
MPAIAAAWLLAFTLSFDDVVIASFVTGPGASTLPIVIFSSVRLGVSPQINALATLLVLAVAVLIVSATLLMRRGESPAR